MVRQNIGTLKELEMALFAMINAMDILFIQTGGTIDKDYPTIGHAYEFIISDHSVMRILEKINPSFNYRSIELLKKDSSDITDKDRMLIKKSCQESPEKYIIITHGTDTMKETAKVLDKINDKVIIITGAMRPERFSNTDADFNIGMAVGAIGVLRSGVYIAMSGLVLEWRDIKKDFELGKFLRIG